MYIRFVQQVLDDAWVSESYWPDFSAGLADVATFSTLLSQSAIDRIEQALELFFARPAQEVLERAREALQGHWKASAGTSRWSFRRRT